MKTGSLSMSWLTKLNFKASDPVVIDFRTP